MYELTEALRIWNRGCDGGGTNPHRGDRALAAMIHAHSLTMNGGVLHAVECLTARDEMSAAQAGYRFFGLDSVADLFSQARCAVDADDDLEDQESLLDQQYAVLIPDDSYLIEQFEKHLRANPFDFAPL